MRAPALNISRRNVSLWIVGSVGVLLLGMLVAGFDLWSQSYYYASTDNGIVSGDYIQVGAPGPGQVVTLDVRVGEAVTAGQSLAMLQMIGQPSSSGATGRVNVHLRSPRTATVVSLPAREGQLVASGERVAVLADPEALWVVGYLDENSLKGVQVGQRAEVQINLLDRTLIGRVAEVLPEFAPAAQSSGTRARANPLIPVKVDLDGDLSGLFPGMSAYVKIRIR